MQITFLWILQALSTAIIGFLCAVHAATNLNKCLIDLELTVVKYN